MKEAITQSVFFGMTLTLLSYQIGLFIKKKTGFALANPMLLSVLLVVVILLALKIPYENYYIGAEHIDIFLTPATVCLAVPLYRQLILLKKYPKAILGGIGAGVLMTMFSVCGLSLAFGLTHEEYVSFLPKSITTAIAMGVSEKMGGIVTITVISIAFTGIFGNIAAETICRIFRITEPVAVGLAIGTSAHAMGTSRAMELGEVQGAMSSLSIVVAGILTVLAIPLFAGISGIRF